MTDAEIIRNDLLTFGTTTHIDGKHVPLTDILRPMRIQRQRTKGWKMPPNTVCVSRPSAWGNTFKVGVDGDAAECVRKFYKAMVPYDHHGRTLADYLLSVANIQAIQHDLRGKHLACWCPIGQPCHADVLLEIANNYPDMNKKENTHE